MKPFNLERALAGDKVVTRDGREVTGIHLFENVTDGYCLGAVLNGCVQAYTIYGLYYSFKEHPADLFMAPKKVTIERWVNVYPNVIGVEFPTKERADKSASKSRVACVKLTGEYEVD